MNGPWLDLLLNNPLLLLFVVVGIGYPLGRLKIAGSSLGVAAVLFVGLAVGSLHPNLKLPENIYQLGVALYIYSVGLSNGPSFVASFRRKGLRDNVFVVSVLVLAALLTGGAYLLLNLKPTLAAGMFAGSLNCTPALAGVLDYLKSYSPPADLDRILNEPVVGYSLAYPMGVIAMIVAIAAAQRWWKVDYNQEAKSLRTLGATNTQLQNGTIAVTRPDAAQETIRDLSHAHGWDVVFGRVRRDGQLFLAQRETRLRVGDLVTVCGAEEDLSQVTAYLGEASAERLELDRSQLDFRRIFVSNPKVAGHRLRDFDLPQQFGAIVTRVRRGDIEFLPHGDTVLELGDRVRVLTHRENMGAVSAFLGDSYRALSEIDFLTFSLGIALGLLLGSVVFTLPGGITLKLGIAGGPLIVGLTLGALERTGPVIWSLPYSANLTLRQIGLTLFLAGVGTRAGYTFFTTLTQGGGLLIFAAGAIITTTTAILSLWIGYRLLKIPMSLLTGVLAGLQTQPAVLGFALEQTGNDLPNIGYATVFPVATIAKIVLAQVMLSVMR